MNRTFIGKLIAYPVECQCPGRRNQIITFFFHCTFFDRFAGLSKQIFQFLDFRDRIDNRHDPFIPGHCVFLIAIAEMLMELAQIFTRFLTIEFFPVGINGSCRIPVRTPHRAVGGIVGIVVIPVITRSIDTMVKKDAGTSQILSEQFRQITDKFPVHGLCKGIGSGIEPHFLYRTVPQRNIPFFGDFYNFFGNFRIPGMVGHGTETQVHFGIGRQDPAGIRSGKLCIVICHDIQTDTRQFLLQTFCQILMETCINVRHTGVFPCHSGNGSVAVKIFLGHQPQFTDNRMIDHIGIRQQCIAHTEREISGVTGCKSVFVIFAVGGIIFLG